MSFIDAYFGTLFDNGEELEILGGLNFIGFTITPDVANGRHNIAVAGAATVASSVGNDSSVSGATVKDALDTLLSSVNTNTANISANTAAIAAFATSLTTTTGNVGTLNLGTGTVGTGGELNVDASFSLYAKNTGSGSSRLLDWAGADISLGDVSWVGAQTLFFDAGTTGFFVYRCGAADVASLSRANGMFWSYRAQASGGIVAMTGRTEANDTTVQLFRWNAATNKIQIGDGISGSGTNGVVAVEARMRAGGTGWTVSVGGTDRWVTTDTQHDAKTLPIVNLGTVGCGAITSTGAIAGTTITGSGSGSFAGVAVGGALTTVTTLNGATVASPTQGTAITTTATIDVSAGTHYDVTAAGGAYAITLGTSGTPVDGETVTLRCTNALANTVTVTNGGTGGGNLGPGGGMVSGKKGLYSYYYDGTATAWKYGGYQRCQ